MHNLKIAGERRHYRSVKLFDHSCWSDSCNNYLAQHISVHILLWEGCESMEGGSALPETTLFSRAMTMIACSLAPILKEPT